MADTIEAMKRSVCIWCHQENCDCEIIVCFDFTRQNPPMILKPKKRASHDISSDEAGAAQTEMHVPETSA